jgi:hypothetical protein
VKISFLSEGLGVAVDREPDDSRIPSESAFYYRVKRALMALGHDVVKVNPQNDGHMVGAPYYIRSRSKSDDRLWFLFHRAYMVQAPHLEFNAGRPVYLETHGAHPWRETSPSHTGDAS